MVTLTPNSKQGKINRNHSMIGPPRSYLPYTPIIRVLNPHNHKWEPGIIKCSTHTPRSCVITMANGGTLRRNRSHIRPTGYKICIQHNSSSHELPMPLNEVPEATPSTLPNESTPTCKQTILGSEVPANTPQMESPAADASLRRSSRTAKPPDRLDL